MRRSKPLSVVVPVFNEVKHITRNLERLINEIQRESEHFEIIVVSDGSTDGTVQQLKDLQHPHCQVIVLERNQGKGAAIRAGFQRARGELLLFIDGGMEIHPKEIHVFMGLMELYNADVVLGSKRHPQSLIFYPWYRSVLSFVFQKLVHFLFDVDVTDTQVGLKLFRRQVIDDILPHLEVNRYGFDLEMLSLAKMHGHGRMLEAPIQMEYFDTNQRPLLRELIHVVRVGLSLLQETLRLHRRLKAIKVKAKASAGDVRQAS
jgi:glycosyltransferase involved in cell wall biosynthesis